MSFTEPDPTYLRRHRLTVVLPGTTERLDTRLVTTF